MKLWLVVLCIILVETNLCGTTHFQEEPIEDNEFAEFEDFDEENLVKETAPVLGHSSSQFENMERENNYDEDEVLVEDVDNEFDHFQDEEEFEGLDITGGNSDIKIEEPSTLKITKVPLHLRARWDSFYLEILMIAGLLVYFINYIAGKSKNCRIAETWYIDNKRILTENFTLVGDTGKSNEEGIINGPIKESESQYSIYCSGRIGCDSLLIELKLIKRQDLVAVLSQLIRPQNDQAHLRIELGKDETDNFVLAIAARKTAIHLSRDMADISVYCPEKRPGEKFNLPSGFCVMSEISEATSAILDNKVLQAINKYTNYVDYIHISDQYSGLKQQEYVIDDF
jgi:hypothetical protein